VIVLTELNTLFDVSVVTGLYDDSKEYPNAGADPDLVVDLGADRKSTDGAIALGRNLLNLLQESSYDVSAAVTAVCAHEYGHILQSKYILKYPNRREQLIDLGDRKYVVGLELHADFISGYFGKIRKSEDQEYKVVAQPRTQANFPDPATHGTRKERGNAVYAGFLASGSSGKLSPENVTMLGLDYVTSEAAWAE
jgi:hypothetical protein